MSLLDQTPDGVEYVWEVNTKVLLNLHMVFHGDGFRADKQGEEGENMVIARYPWIIVAVGACLRPELH